MHSWSILAFPCVHATSQRKRAAAMLTISRHNLKLRPVKKYGSVPRMVVSLAAVICLGAFFTWILQNLHGRLRGTENQSPGFETFVADKDGSHIYKYSRNSPLIFVGGFPRSGTTLMRAMLDAHPEVRCGEETNVVPDMVNRMGSWQQQGGYLREAGVTSAVLDDAAATFILQIIALHGPPAARLCNKDPLAMTRASYLLSLFPAAKILFMVRDGRAVVHSLLDRNVDAPPCVKGPRGNQRACLQKWNNVTEGMLAECDQINNQSKDGFRCTQIKFEELVLNPSATLRQILEFLELPWSESVLHHERYINKPGGVSLNRMEPSTGQVIKPVNTEGLYAWVGSFPDELLQEMDSVAPMLSKFGYDPRKNPPSYGFPEARVVANTVGVLRDAAVWAEREKEARAISKIH